MSVKHRKVMLLYRSNLLPEGHQGVCECGHQFDEGERFLGYPCGDGTHWFVCLSCHFWNVHEATK